MFQNMYLIIYKPTGNVENECKKTFIQESPQINKRMLKRMNHKSLHHMLLQRNTWINLNIYFDLYVETVVTLCDNNVQCLTMLNNKWISTSFFGSERILQGFDALTSTSSPHLSLHASWQSHGSLAQNPI